MNEIILLRKEGKSISAIVNATGYSKSTVSLYCNRAGLGGRIDGKGLNLEKHIVEKVREYYLTHTCLETTKEFKISISTVKRYVSRKIVFLTDEELKQRNYSRLLRHRQRMKEKGIQYLGGKCIRCGYDKCNAALHFHHRNPEEKAFNFGSYSNLAWDNVRSELDKCDLLCANCHAEIHHEYFLNRAIGPDTEGRSSLLQRE